MHRKSPQILQKDKKHLTEKQLHHKINCYISIASSYVELVMGCFIIAVIVVLTGQMIMDFPHMLQESQNSGFLDLLANVLTLVVGLEFVKMLCLHTPETVIEVLMFATARQMVVEHLSPKDTLIGVITIAILFAIRKYLFLNKAHDTLSDETEQSLDELLDEEA